ncbi:MAG: glycosyltransferase family 4 protein [Nanoarchaeota archaeon]
MNLLIINDHGLFGGGTENRIRIFVEQLIKNKTVHEVHVLQRFSDQREKSVKNIFFHPLNSKQSGYLAARKIIKEHNINFVQVHNLVSIKPYVVLAAKQAHVPVVWWVHDYWLLCGYRSLINPYRASQEKLCRKANMQRCHKCMSLKSRIKHMVWKKIMNVCDAAIAPSVIMKEIHESEDVLKGKWKIVTPWIDSLFLDNEGIKREKMPAFKKKEGEKILLFVGSLMEFKGAWVAMRSLKHVINKFPNTRLVFVGGNQEPESRYRQDIEMMAEKEGLNKSIVFLGKKEKEDLIKTYKQADIFLCPTVCMESFGQTWAEAMACGIPVVASAIGGIPEYIEDRKTGLLFTAGDETALAFAVITLLTKPAYAKQLALQGKKYVVQNCNPTQACREILSIMQSISQSSIRTRST